MVILGRKHIYVLGVEWEMSSIVGWCLDEFLHSREGVDCDGECVELDIFVGRLVC